MLTRRLAAAGFALVAFSLASPVSAGWLGDFFCSVRQDFQERNRWPDQYVCADREAVRSVFVTMTTNGWRRQNMLGEFHFKSGSGQLTEAGRLKVRWILTACPEQHRLVYVHIAATQEETSARVAAVRQWAAQVAPGNLVPVLTTSITDDGWPADRVDLINRSFQKSAPAPRLPYLPAPGDTGGTSGK